MKGTVYVLEDDQSICGLIRVSLELNGLQLRTFSTCKEFLEGIQEARPDVALLDIMLPDGSGLEVLKAVKARYPDVWCIMLSALGKEEDRVNGLNLGADDYMPKPFSVLELTARINGVMRRKAKSAQIVCGNLTLDEETMQVTLNGTPLTLNRKEFELLRFFMKNPGKVLTRDTLLTEIWGYESGETRTLDNHIARLRKLGIGNLETVFGVGYKFNL